MVDAGRQPHVGVAVQLLQELGDAASQDHQLFDAVELRVVVLLAAALHVVAEVGARDHPPLRVLFLVRRNKSRTYLRGRLPHLYIYLLAAPGGRLAGTDPNRTSKVEVGT